MTTAKIFTNGRSQAVRLPKEYRFKGKEVAVKRVGDMLVLVPKNKIAEIFADSVNHFPPDFKIEREARPEERGPIL